MKLPYVALALSTTSLTLFCGLALAAAFARAVASPAEKRSFFVAPRRAYIFSLMLVAVSTATVLMVTSRNRRASVPKMSAESANNQIVFNTTRPDISQSTAPDAKIARLSFERLFPGKEEGRCEPWIFVKDFATGAETKLAQGSSAEMSPSGEQIAFAAGKSYDLSPPFGDPVTSAGRTDPFRIQIIDLETRKVRDFESLKGIKHFDPLWSPDGKSLAFTTYESPNRGDVAVIDVATGEWHNVSRNLDLSEDSWLFELDGWAADNLSLIFHTSAHIYEIALDGRLLKKIPTLGLGIDGTGTRVLMSSDKTFLVFNRTDEDEHGAPIEVIYKFDLQAHKLSRITPAGMYSESIRWLVPDREILFTCNTAGEDWKAGKYICRMKIDGTGFSKVVKNADYASCATK